MKNVPTRGQMDSPNCLPLYFRWERGEDHQSCPLCRQKIKDKGEPEIEVLEDHLAYLESRKSTFKRMTSILIDTVDKLETEAQLENFANLEESHTVTEALMTRWIGK